MKAMHRILIVSTVLFFCVGILNAMPLETEEITDSLLVAEVQPLEGNLTVIPPRPVWRVAIGGGYAYRLAERLEQFSPALKDMEDKLMHGFNLMIDVQYFIRPFWGFGVTGNMVRTNTKGENLNLPGYGYASLCKESQEFYYIAPTFALKADIGKCSFVFDGGIGPLFFRDKIKIDYWESNGNRATVGVNLGGAFEGILSSGIGMGVKLSYTVGTIPSLTLTGPGGSDKINERISLSNLMLTGFLSFRTP